MAQSTTNHCVRRRRILQQWRQRWRQGGAEPQNRGPLSRGLFSNDLLGLYDDAGSFQVQDYDKEDGYGNG